MLLANLHFGPDEGTTTFATSAYKKSIVLYSGINLDSSVNSLKSIRSSSSRESRSEKFLKYPGKFNH